MRKVLGLMLGVALAISAGQVAHASGHDTKNPQFRGILSSVDTASSPATFTMTKPTGVNDAGRAWVTAHPGDITFDLVPGTKFNGPQHLGRSATDYRAGDFVQIKAAPNTSGGLDAHRVKLFLQHYDGTLTTFTSGSGGTFTWTSENRPAQAWNTSNANPVSFVVTSSSRVSGNPQPGDAAVLSARPSAADSTILEAVHLSNATS